MEQIVTQISLQRNWVDKANVGLQTSTEHKYSLS